jgi:DNA-binding XRE family transcriptional regulator/phage-related protein
LPGAVDFLVRLDDKARDKIYYNIKKAQLVNDNELFKKLNEFIWQIRTLYNSKAYRLLSFWYTTNDKQSLVVATHGILKKAQKTPPNEIKKAEEIRKQYLNNKMTKLLTMDNRFKTVSIDTMIDKHIGKRGTVRREAFENELRIDLLGQAIKQARQERNLTQEQLGELVGVQKAQISKIENSVKNARFETILKVFDALGAKVNFNVELNDKKLAY